MILNNFDNNAYEEVRKSELSLAQKRIWFDKFVIDEDMDNNLQREVLIDLFFHAVIYCSEKEFDFKVVEILLAMIEDELLSMIHLTFDMSLPPSERITMLHTKMTTNMKKSNQSPLKITEWKSICDFLTSSFYRDLDAYYFMLNNIPSIAERNVDVIIDTPICCFERLT